MRATSREKQVARFPLLRTASLRLHSGDIMRLNSMIVRILAATCPA
jgi:hypothetical protein